MKTDTLFFELFTLDPQLLLALLKLEIRARYTFQSITVKSTEKRFDGYFQPIEGEGPLIFLEVQGYNDPRVYWRLVREIATSFEQRNDEPPFLAIVLFLDPAFAPARCQVQFEAPSRLITASLEECLKAVREGAGALNVLKPLVVESEEVLRLEVGQWKAGIEALSLPEHLQKRLLDLLEYAILQRFPRLTRKEIEAMIQLTPLEETAAGRELIELGEARGEVRGEARGELIGVIRTCQKVLGVKVDTRQKLARRSLEELRQLARELETRLRAPR